MRVIKFRVWDKAEKRFVENGIGTHAYNEWYLTLDGKVVSFSGALTDSIDIVKENLNYYDTKNRSIIREEDRFVIQQAIGVKDKKDKDIFEGDIVSFKIDIGDFISSFVDRIGVVKYSERSNFYYVHNIKDDSHEVINDYSRLYTIIGNIFENKELLNERD